REGNAGDHVGAGSHCELSPFAEGTDGVEQPEGTEGHQQLSSPQEVDHSHASRLRWGGRELERRPLGTS
ncbi:hypothetical protein PMAYCL1PPCAC_25646, partial [Pristionchus mayeri]